MPRWLCKHEPASYSFDDLLRDGSTVWDDVSNALARKHLWQMKPGDQVLSYHTGKERAVVGEMVVASAPYLDRESDDKAAVVVKMKPVRKLAKPVPLAIIRADKILAKSDLVRLQRLSVVPVTEAQWKRVVELSLAKERKSD